MSRGGAVCSSEARGPRPEAWELGFTLMEMVVALTIFGAFLIICAILTKEMFGYEKKLPVDFLTHPQVSAVIARLRRDVEDATAPYYPDAFQNYIQSDSTLILYSLDEDNHAKTIVWDFTDPDVVRRRAYNVGILSNEWIARGLPKLRINAYEVPDHAYSVRVQAVDNHGILAIDQIFQPRPHE